MFCFEWCCDFIPLVISSSRQSFVAFKKIIIDNCFNLRTIKFQACLVPNLADLVKKLPLA